MKWHLAKIIFQIVCGSGEHKAQFDEQLRLIVAKDEDEAFEKACNIGKQEQETFLNQKKEIVRWKFVNVAELYKLSKLLMEQNYTQALTRWTMPMLILISYTIRRYLFKINKAANCST